MAAVAWLIQTLTPRAWTEYERRSAAYGDVVERIDALVSGDVDETRAYLRAIRKVWLIGTDEVELAWNALASAIKDGKPTSDRERLYQAFVAAMRSDLNKRRWLPPDNTTLLPSDFKLEGPGTEG